MSVSIPVRKLLFGTILLLSAAFRMDAQQELMLHHLPVVWHSNATNPAFFPEGKFLCIGLPGIGLDASHSGSISYSDLFVKKGGKTTIDFSNALNQLAPSNTLHLDQRLETVSLGIRLPGKFWLQAGHANRLSGSIVYPKTLPSMIWDGNAQYIGQTVDIALKTDISDWNEWSIGLAKGIGALTLGFKAKFLNGTSALFTDKEHNRASITTSDDIYQLTLDADFGFYASSLISAIDTSGLGFDLSVGDLKGKAFSKNTGMAFDFGVQYKVNERITLDVSLLDAGGRIKWDNNANYFISQGSYTYAGVNIPGSDIISGADSLDFSTKLDTLNDIFNFEKSAQNFETQLPLRGYLGARYALNKRWQLGLSAYFQKRESEKALIAVGAAASWRPVKWVSLGAMYSINDKSAANLGFHLALKPGPVQFYLASDNLLNAVNLKHSAAVNLRSGLSLVF